MSSPKSNETLPNPDTPLAFLPPEAAYQTSVAVYILVASLGVLLWDILDNIVDEFKLLFKCRISINTVAYFGSRLGSLGYILGSSIFQTAPIGNCLAGETIPDIFYPISLGGSALLFFIRLRAVYNGERLIVAFFFALWLGVLACTMLIPITVTGGHIGLTPYCEDADVPSFAFAAIFAPLIHDTLVFCAISWRLLQNAYVDLNISNGIRVAVLGEYLPIFTRGMLRDGQKYYLVTLISNMITVIMVYDSSVPIPMRSMCSMPNVVLTNIMACRVYRQTRARLENCEDNGILGNSLNGKPAFSAISFGPPPDLTQQSV